MPISDISISLKPSLNAGESLFNDKSRSARFANFGSAMIELESCPNLRQLLMLTFLSVLVKIG